ncbi:ERF024 protein [Hibiscus syriacus]|uniref:ERF024 protein n=1 Tax=Hibiscus syriacus TaxID=106335 RepID=A0A6A2WGX5_HIBSY|nr:ERF024 protein [Hibiscus syriacus]
MEMENHHPYGMPDLRQLFNGRPSHFQTVPQGPELFSSGNRNLPLPQPHHHQFDMMQMAVGRHVGHELMPPGLHHEFHSDATATNNVTTTAAVAVNSGSTPSASCGFDGDAIPFGGDGGTGRWPRQETLTLLEIRSRLDPKFKEANQKGPLWEEVSRIMCEDHGYQRSGKKCREKFENLYKYYKKTREGKAGRQDGKHYRFFRQLDALYGETSNSVSGQESQLVGNHFRTAAAMENGTSLRKKRGCSRCWKAKIKEFIDSQMRKLIERQEAWLEKLTKTLEEKEKERVSREEQWRKEEAVRTDREHKFWANERAWIEGRDSALMEALHNLTGKQLKGVSSSVVIMSNEMENQSETLKDTVMADEWQETEISKLILLRTTMEGCSEEILWEEIAAKMACLGFEKSALMCKEKWDRIGAYLMKTKESNKKRKENTGDHCGYYQNNKSLYTERVRLQENDSSSPCNSNAVGNGVNDSCFRFLMNDGENYWESYGLKLNKGGNQ